MTSAWVSPSVLGDLSLSLRDPDHSQFGIWTKATAPRGRNREQAPQVHIGTSAPRVWLSSPVKGCLAESQEEPVRLDVYISPSEGCLTYCSTKILLFSPALGWSQADSQANCLGPVGRQETRGAGGTQGRCSSEGGEVGSCADCNQLV